jgi:hypothetical protein
MVPQCHAVAGTGWRQNTGRELPLDCKHGKEVTQTTVVYNGVTKFFVGGKEFFFGFRTTQSRQEIDDFKVYQLK